MTDEHLFGIRGFVIDTPEFGELRARRNGGLIIDKGRILARGDYDELRRTHRTPAVDWIDYSSAAIFPGPRASSIACTS